MRPVFLAAVLLMSCRAERGSMFEVSRTKPKAAEPVAICPGETTSTPACSEVRPDAGLKQVPDPRVVHRVEPRYPAAARERGIGGTVILQIGVRSDGTVGGVCVAKPLPCGLSDAAAAAVRQWRFEPQEADAVTTVTIYLDAASTAR